MKILKNSIIIFLTLVLFQVASSAQDRSKAEKSVVMLLEKQASDWNRGDIEAFMEGYWNSPELTFIGRNGVTKGWNQTLVNYQKSYPDKAAMGTLRFDLKDVDEQSKKVVTVVGKFFLQREGETLSGNFLLVVRKIKGNWKIVADHTSG